MDEIKKFLIEECGWIALPNGQLTKCPAIGYLSHSLGSAILAQLHSDHRALKDIETYVDHAIKVAGVGRK